MRLQVPMGKYLVLLLTVIISILIAKSGIYKYVVWKTYHNPSASFSFRYPSAWSVCDESYYDYEFDMRFTHVFNEEISCETASASENNLSMSIIGDGWYEAVKETDIKSFLINSEEKENERIKNGELPIVGSRIPWKLEQYENSWYLPKNISFAKVKSFTENIETYVFLFQGQVYSIEKPSDEGFSSLLSKLILRSFKLY